MISLMRMFSRIKSLIITCAALKAFVISLCMINPLPAQSQTAAAQGQGFTFALIGDLGYFPREEPGVENVLADLNKNDSLAFVVHVGDLSSPRFGCTDEMQARRLAQFRASAHPFVYTPGDNEWTDCHDGEGVKGGNPLERLATLRKVFFEGEQSLGQRTLPLTRQSQSSDPIFAKYRENVRWDHGGVTFVTVNIPGSNNGLGRSLDGDAEYAERNKVDLAWVHEGFEHAKANNSRAIMIMQQANIFPDLPPFPGDPKKAEGFAEIRELLEREATAFEKPVVLVHGDSHYFRIDNPFRPKREKGMPSVPALENFLRLETFGSPNHHWVQVTVDPNDPNVFTIHPRIVAANVVKRR
jgi:hypothetical protein